MSQLPFRPGQLLKVTSLSFNLPCKTSGSDWESERTPNQFRQLHLSERFATPPRTSSNARLGIQ